MRTSFSIPTAAELREELEADKEVQRVAEHVIKDLRGGKDASVVYGPESPRHTMLQNLFSEKGYATKRCGNYLHISLEEVEQENVAPMEVDPPELHPILEKITENPWQL